VPDQQKSREEGLEKKKKAEEKDKSEGLEGEPSQEDHKINIDRVLNGT